MTIFQAIETKYLKPTGSKGGRIKATCWGGSATISYPHELNTDQAHYAAAQALREKMATLANGFGDDKSIWKTGHWVQGGNAKGDGYVFTVEAR